MGEVHRARPFPRGLTGTAGAGNYDVDLGFHVTGYNTVIPKLLTVVVAADAVVQLMQAGDTSPGQQGSAGDIGLGATLPLKADVVYTFETGADTLRFVSSEVVYRIIAEY